MRDWTIPQAARASRSTGSSRLVLFVIAGCWNPTDEESRPGNRYVAEIANVSPSTVSRAVARLVESGDLRVIREGRGTRPTTYDVPALRGGPLRSDPPRADHYRDPSRADHYDAPAIPPERITNENGGAIPPERITNDPLRSASDPLAIRPGRSESRKEEVDQELTRARAREGSQTLDPTAAAGFLDEPLDAYREPGARGVALARAVLAPPLRSTENGRDPR